ncbi:MAG: hypothetical protein NVS3B17_18600 [Vulcanimicrobiaceae bacterium]
MPADKRDREALDVLASRTFADAALASLSIDLQTRRLTLRAYGELRPGDPATYLATIAFFGTHALELDGATTAFPQRARIVTIRIRYGDADDTGTAHVDGRSGWALRFEFEGIAYEETPTVLASLADDD